VFASANLLSPCKQDHQRSAPSELPVEQPTRYEMFVNLQTAKTFGLILPLAVLGRADEVIE
jgi:putative tryptophan/tyrosine transport system substrate-binding protein